MLGSKDHLGREESSAVVIYYFHLKASNPPATTLHCFRGSDIRISPLTSRDQCLRFVFRLCGVFFFLFLYAPPVSATDAAFWLRLTGDNNDVFCCSCFSFRYHWKMSQMCDCFISLYYISLFVVFFVARTAIQNKPLLPPSLLRCFLLFLSWYVKHSQWIMHCHLVSLCSFAPSNIHFSFGQTINNFSSFSSKLKL